MAEGSIRYAGGTLLVFRHNSQQHLKELKQKLDSISLVYDLRVNKRKLKLRLLIDYTTHAQARF